MKSLIFLLISICIFPIFGSARNKPLTRSNQNTAPEVNKVEKATNSAGSNTAPGKTAFPSPSREYLSNLCPTCGFGARELDTDTCMEMARKVKEVRFELATVDKNKPEEEGFFQLVTSFFTEKDLEVNNARFELASVNKNKPEGKGFFQLVTSFLGKDYATPIIINLANKFSYTANKVKTAYNALAGAVVQSKNWPIETKNNLFAFIKRLATNPTAEDKAIMEEVIAKCRV